MAVLDQIVATLGVDFEGKQQTYRQYQIVAGDQESFEMMHKVKVAMPQKYRWLLPWPSDLHVLMNFAKTVLNSNNFAFTLQHLGMAYGLNAGHLHALEIGS